MFVIVSCISRYKTFFEFCGTDIGIAADVLKNL
nr:MAG TPA: hypothetical protein [Caudoviricetes sp.]